MEHFGYPPDEGKAPEFARLIGVPKQTMHYWFTKNPTVQIQDAVKQRIAAYAGAESWDEWKRWITKWVSKAGAAARPRSPRDTWILDQQPHFLEGVQLLLELGEAGLRALQAAKQVEQRRTPNTPRKAEVHRS